MNPQRRRVAILGAGAAAMVGIQGFLMQHNLQLREHEEEQRRRHDREPRVSVRQWITRRQEFGWYEHLMVELETEDPASFVNMLRVQPAMFHELVQRLAPRIQRYDTNYRRSLPPGLRVAITLKYIATGDRYKMLMHGFRVPHHTVALIVRVVCEAIIEELQHEFVKCPTTEAEWREVVPVFFCFVLFFWPEVELPTYPGGS